MKTVFLTITILFFTLCGIGQTTEFFRTYDFGNTEYPLLNNLIEINNIIYCNGNIRSPNQKILLLKTDLLGNISDTNIVGNDTGRYFTGTFVNPSNNKLLIPGYHENTTTYIVKPYLLFVDTNLLMVSDSVYAIENINFEGNIKIKHSYYFAGNTTYNNSGDILSYGYNFLLWKTDTNFNKIISNSIGLENIHESCIVTISGYDNNLLLGGLTTINGNSHDWYLVNIDTSGAILGEYYYGNPLKPDADGIKSISLSNDSSYFLTGLKYKYDFGSGNYYYGASVIKIDRNFNTLWEKQIGSTIQGIGVNKLIPSKDGNQVLLTQKYAVISNHTIYSQTSKFDNDGNIRWFRDYLQGDTTQYLRYRAWDMIETSDSGFALCGTAIDTIHVGPYQQAWLVKTDSLGCDGLRSCNDTAMVVEILNYPDTLCQNDTNFIEVRLKGRSAPYRLYANGSLTLDSIYYPYTLPLWIDTTIMVFPTDTGSQDIVITLHEPWDRTASDTVQVYVVNCQTNFASTDFYKRKVEIYPNPATTELHVKVRGVIEDSYTITMYDTQGKTVDIITTNEQETVIDISKYSQGIYWIRVLGNNIVRSEKIIKLMTN